MNDKDRDLIASVLRAAGKAGEQGFSYLVHYEVISGITNMLGWGAAGVVAWILAKQVWAWKPDQNEPAAVARGAAMVALSIFAIVCISGFTDGVRELIAPEGAAIFRAMHASL